MTAGFCFTTKTTFTIDKNLLIWFRLFQSKLILFNLQMKLFFLILTQDSNSDTDNQDSVILTIVVNKNQVSYYFLIYLSTFFLIFSRDTLKQGWATIFVRGPHCVFIRVTRAGFQSKRVI